MDNALLRAIPGVDELMRHLLLCSACAEIPAPVLADAVRAELDALRV